jgi:methyltransferase (TIGR00027 family)
VEKAMLSEKKDIYREGSRTAKLVAAWRAIESAKPANVRLFYDPYAKYFAGEEGERYAQIAENALKGHRQIITLRTRYIDDYIEKCLENNAQQLVILGAGYDCRALRLSAVREKARVFEIDHPDTHPIKIRTIVSIEGFLPAHVEYIAIDLEKEGINRLKGKLEEKGYETVEKAVFILEGVLQYLAEPAVDNILNFIATNSAKGSGLIFNYFSLPTNIVDALSQYGEIIRNEPLKFQKQPDQMVQYLQSKGYQKINNISIDQVKDIYLSNGIINESFLLTDRSLGDFAPTYFIIDAVV